MSDTTAAKPAGKRLIRLVLTLGYATLCGALLNLLDVPLAWMLGAMTGTVAAALAGVRLERSDALRALMLAVLGVAIGSAFKPGVLADMAGWMPSLGWLATYTIAIALLGGLVLRVLAHWNRATAFFSAVPGGLTDMLLAGVERGGDERALALVHAIRIMMTVLIIPLWFTVTGGVPDHGVETLSPSWSGLTGTGVLWLAGAGIVGLAAGRVFRLPAYVFIGPMAVSAAIHLAGLTQSHPPGGLVNAAQVVIGAAIGCRFVGVDLRTVGRIMAVSAIYGFALVIGSAGVALVIAPLTGQSATTLWLAYAPGGLPEMVLMSLSLGLDPAFVSAHHLFRFTFILLTARIVYRVFEWLTPQW